MANVDVSVTSALSPERAWSLASNLDRFNEWLTIFGGWKSPVPEVIEKGTTVSSLIKVKGFRNTIHWEVTTYDEPHRIEMRGSGRGGVRIDLKMTIDDKKPGTTFHLTAGLSGALLDGWKEFYLPVIQLLEPRLVPGALIVADNTSMADTKPYVEYVRDPANGYVSVNFLGKTSDTMEISCRV